MKFKTPNEMGCGKRWPRHGRYSACGGWFGRTCVLIASVSPAVVAMQETLEPGSFVQRVDIPDPDLTGMQLPVVRCIREARDGVVKEPDSSAMWGLFAAVCHAHSLHQPAAVCYRQAKSLDQNEPRYGYLLAVVLIEVGGDRSEIVELLNGFIRAKPGYAPAHVRLGWLREGQGKLDEARSAFAKAVDIDPTLAIARFGLGQALLALGDIQTAVRHLERAADLAPRDGASRAALARAYLRLGQKERATELAEAVRSMKSRLLFPDPLTQSVMNLGRSSLAVHQRFMLFMKVGESARAIPELLTYAETYPVHPYCQMLLALAYLRTDQPNKAEQHFANAIEQRTLILQSVDAGALEEKRVANADRVIAAFGPEYIKHVTAVGGEKWIKRALEQFDRVASALPASAPFQIAWGEACRTVGDLDAAVRHFLRATALDPNSAAAFYSLGLVAEERDQIETATQSFERAARLDPSGPAAARLAAMRTGRSGGR